MDSVDQQIRGEKVPEDLDQEKHDLNKSPSQEEPAQTAEDEAKYPAFKIVLPIVLCIYLSVFLIALDRTIIGVAIPAISNEFESFGDISWYEAAFLLTFAVTQLPMGIVFKFFSAKWVFIALVALFEVGSTICAAAPTSNSFIVGRAIAGIGAGGIGVGGLVIIRSLVPLAKVPAYSGAIGAAFGLASIMGPLVGGAFTSNLTWRWCFWINLPIGGVAVLCLVLLLPPCPGPSKLEGTTWEKIKQFDPLGNAVLAPGLILILLALQWGGIVYPWNSARVVSCLVVGSILVVAFIFVQWWVQENGMVPPRIISQRTIAACSVISLTNGAVLVIVSFYLPIWFQAIQGVSAANAGVRLLPYFLSTVIFVIGSGAAVSKIGYFAPFFIVGIAIEIAASALFTTLRVDTSTGKWIGYQIFIGAGAGLCLIQSQNAALTVLGIEDVPIGVTILNFFAQVGASIFISICQTILSGTLTSQLEKNLPGFNIGGLATAGATEIRSQVPKEQLPILLKAYNTGIDNVFYFTVALCCVALFAAFFVEWKSILKDGPDAKKSETGVELAKTDKT
ncbi:hypothetical protein MMC25_002722 [Agyrium rufum]|nr:hypothetical protein [Agyrium rufum]